MKHTNGPGFSIIVVGSGAAGIAAAVAAARHGQSVLLIERYGFPGGTATAGLVHHWDPVHQMEASGIIVELYDRLKKSGALIDYDKKGVPMPFAYWEGGCGFDPEAYKAECLAMLHEAGVRTLFHTVVTGASVENGRIAAVEIFNKGGRQTVSAQRFVDASGDGDLFAYAGCSYSVGDENGNCMAPTLAFRLGGVDTEALYTYLEEHPEEFGNHPRIGKYMRNPRESVILQGFYSLIRQASERGDLKISLPESGIGMTVQPRYGEFHVNATRTTGLDPLDGWSLSELESLEREHVQEVFRFIRSYLPGCENAYILQTAEQAGIRESRRLNGVYALTVDDIRKGVRFDDRIVRSKWAHCDTHSGKDMRWSFEFIEGPYYVPYRSILPKEIRNLLVAGRCISGTREALSSLRIMPVGACIGQAAGTAAALSAQADVMPDELSCAELQQALRRDGVTID